MFDLPEGFTDRLAWFLDYFEPKIDEYNDLLTQNYIFIKRTANVGVISAADAIRWGLTGPCLRGSGVAWDLRRCLPYELYDRFEFDIPIGLPAGSEILPAGSGPSAHPATVPPEVVVGDCWSRYFVRMEEMKQSVRILRQCLKQLPAGEARAKVPRVLKLPKKEIYLEVEGARGQLGYLVVGEDKPIPRRVKIRGPSFCNLSIATHVCRNVLLADVAAIIGSIDVVMGEVDR
jgi:NADH-quinone oxidoreductase subunit D